MIQVIIKSQRPLSRRILLTTAAILFGGFISVQLLVPKSEVHNPKQAYTITEQFKQQYNLNGPADYILATVVFFTSTQTWSVPANWNSTNNSVQCIGSGAAGAGSASNGGSFQPGEDIFTWGGTGGVGGGGGAYSKSVNVTLSGGGSAAVTCGLYSSTTFKDGSTCVAVAASGSTGGDAGSSVAIGPGSYKMSGGNGASAGIGGNSSNLFQGGGGGGGGGAGGPNGNGTDGASGSNGTAAGGAGGSGGYGDNFNTAPDTNGGQFGSGVGPGGGGTGGLGSAWWMTAVVGTDGNGGGSYGTGGGGAGAGSGNAGGPGVEDGPFFGGTGTGGVICVTYVPLTFTAGHQNFPFIP